MIELYCQQGSQEWLDAHCGVISASMFKIAREKVNTLTEQQLKYFNAVRAGCDERAAMEFAGYKAKPKSETLERALALGVLPGDPSEAAKNYAFKLAFERESGTLMSEGFTTWAMQRGHELEPAARATFEIESGMTVMPVGFALTEDRKFGASADGYIGSDGGVELKCLVSPERLREILFDANIADFQDQCQGGMWITGRKWWRLCFYCPALATIGRELTVFEIKRDDDYINEMELDLIAFDRLVESYRGRLTKVAA